MLRVSSVEKDRHARAEARRRYKNERAARDGDAHHRNREALLARQHRVVQVGIKDAITFGHPSHQLWYGRPMLRWNGDFPIPEADCTGDLTTAMGSPIWTGKVANRIRLWAVVCPVASRLSNRIAAHCRSTGVRVYAETPGEASPLAAALRWRTSDIYIHGSPGNRPSLRGCSSSPQPVVLRS